MRLKRQQGFGLLGLVAVVVVGAALVGVSVWIGTVIGKATASTGQAAVAMLQARDRAAGIVHNPSSPAPTQDGNHLIWTYVVAGQDAAITGYVRVGPISSDINTTEIQSSKPGWSGGRQGSWVQWRGAQLGVDESISLSFKTTRDAQEGAGMVQGQVYVNVVPANAGNRTKTVQTTVPIKPN